MLVSGRVVIFQSPCGNVFGGIQHVIYFGLCVFLHFYYRSPIHSKKWCVNIAMHSTVCISRHATSSPVIAYLNPWAPILYPPGHPPGERRLGSGLLPQIRRVSRGSGVPGKWAHGVGWLGMDELKFWGHVFSWNKAAFSWSFFPTCKTKRKSTQFGYEISDNSRTQDFPRFKMKTEDGKTAGKSDIVSHTHLSLPWPWVTTNHRFIRTAMTMIGVAKTCLKWPLI